MSVFVDVGESVPPSSVLEISGQVLRLLLLLANEIRARAWLFTYLGSVLR